MGLTKDDLIQKCTRCNGEGWIYDPPRQPNQGSYGRVVMQSKETCGACYSTGEVLTEEGKAIASVISLMRRQGSL